MQMSRFIQAGKINIMCTYKYSHLTTCGQPAIFTNTRYNGHGIVIFVSIHSSGCYMTLLFFTSVSAFSCRRATAAVEGPHF